MLRKARERFNAKVRAVVNSVIDDVYHNREGNNHRLRYIADEQVNKRVRDAVADALPKAQHCSVCGIYLHKDFVVMGPKEVVQKERWRTGKGYATGGYVKQDVIVQKTYCRQHAPVASVTILI